MNLLDRLLGHDLAATRELLQICLTMPDEALDREFDAGWGTLRRTFDHMIVNIELWTDLMLARTMERPANQVSAQQLLDRLERSYADFAALARDVERDGRHDELFVDVLDEPPTQKSLGGGIGHVITHNMHHRAEIQHMLHRSGVESVPEGDLMGWDQRRRLEAQG